MLYTYKCETCGKVQDFEFDMNAERPRTIGCEDCKTDTMYRVFGVTTIVPDSFKALGGSDGFNYEKRNRIHKKMF